MVQIALTVFPGVSGDECDAFALVLAQLPGAQVVRVGTQVGRVTGAGSIQRVERTFDEVPRPDVVVVPGGLGVRRTVRDDDLADWLRRVEPTCRWVVGSSTGTVVLAAAGLLQDQPAATHWLAAPLLESYGSAHATERMTQSGRIITCEGRVTAVDVALLLIARLYGTDWVERARDGLARHEFPEPARPSGVRVDRARSSDRRSWWSALRKRSIRARTRRPRSNPELQVSDWVEMELVEMEVTDSTTGGPGAT